MIMQIGVKLMILVMETYQMMATPPSLIPPGRFNQDVVMTDGVGEASGAVGGDICEATNILSSDSPESENEICGSLANELAEWANAFQVKHNAIDNLLKRLKHHGHQDLPSTARTLIKTPRNIQIDTKSDMDYYYIGVKEEIVKHFAKYLDALKTEVSHIFISFNIDGLPFFKSTNKALWPILCAINLEPMETFPVALAFEHSKPKN